MGRHSDGRTAGSPALPPASLLAALAAAAVVSALVVGIIAARDHGASPHGRPVDLNPSPTLLVSPSSSESPTGQ